MSVLGSVTDIETWFRVPEFASAIICILFAMKL